MEKKIKRIGNFIILTNRDKRGGFLRLESVNKQWRIEWREDSSMYGNLLSLCQMKENIVESYLERLIVSYFTHTTHIHDWLCILNGGIPLVDKDGSPVTDENGQQKINYVPFMDAYWKLINEEVAREVSYQKEPTKEEDDEALKEVGEIQEISSELKKLDNENSGNG